MCIFTSPASGGAKGKCTQTAGYVSQAEIRDIIMNNPSARTSYDGSTKGNVVVYDSTE
jgi:chitinase